VLRTLAGIQVPNMREGYASIAKWVLSTGSPVSPRGQATREVLDALIVVEDPTDALPIGIGRKLNPRIAAAEALQLVGGFSSPRLMMGVQPRFREFMDGNDAGLYQHGAYGPRVRSQMEHAERRLRRDPSTRQSVVTVWSSSLDLPDDTLRDYPCTLSLHFLIRGGRLELHTTMRSNDVWWGLAYDAFQFTQLQLTMANVLGLEPGPYAHRATSLHVYERDADGINALTCSTTGPQPDRPLGFTGATFWHASRAARQIAMRQEPTTTSERWYATTLKEYL
jgi:thymidylate synthase